MNTKNLTAAPSDKIVVFGATQIRRAWVDGQRYFSVVDVIGALTDSASPPKYWDAMKRREKASSDADLSTLCRKVPLMGADGKTLIVEVTGERKKDKIAKVVAARALRVPAVNNHGGFGRRACVEIADPWDAEKLIRARMKQKFST